MSSYEIFGLPSDGSLEEVERTYRGLMKKHQPDLVSPLSRREQQRAEELGKEINRAAAEINGKTEKL